MMATSKSTGLGSPPRTVIGGSLEIPRMINGLWQLAGGHDQSVQFAEASTAMSSLVEKGLDAFDMADHYGDAELVVGYHNNADAAGLKTTAFTKWCPPENGIRSFENAERAVNLALDRLQQKQIALLQYHAWDYSDDTFIHNISHLSAMQKQGKIGLIGLTNTDAAHLQMLVDSGFRIATNQVSCSLIDRRVTRGRLNAVCLAHDVGILAYGTLLGGFLSEKWLGRPEPTELAELNWSLRKYLRFIRAAGGWDAFQRVLAAVAKVAEGHAVLVSAVATRYVLDIPSVKAVIVGTRLRPDSAAEYATRNLLAFTFELTDADRTLIAEAQEGLQDIPNDCGDEYRYPPFLTAAGNLSDHIEETDRSRKVQEAAAHGQRIEYSSGSEWEPIAGYCRAVRVGNSIHVSGTTANSPIKELPNIGGRSPASQTVRILDIVEGALKALGSSMKDITRTRIMIQNQDDCEPVSRAHGWRLGIHGILPANTLVTNGIVGDEMLVEVETWAEVGSGEKGVLTIT
ncbi:NADP-dependent oxidoreductase domain-containing protein [Xylariaceae sp. FL0804]|nr:NADP-dependent oxidoreductase domain-containing protein [Xylariaceae sp. FL0804]